MTEPRSKYTIVIERNWVEDGVNHVTVMATIAELGGIWMPVCLWPMCSKSGLSMTGPGMTVGEVTKAMVDHLEIVHWTELPKPRGPKPRR